MTSNDPLSFTKMFVFQKWKRMTIDDVFFKCVDDQVLYEENNWASLPVWKISEFNFFYFPTNSSKLGESPRSSSTHLFRLLRSYSNFSIAFIRRLTECRWFVSHERRSKTLFWFGLMWVRETVLIRGWSNIFRRKYFWLVQRSHN